MSVHKQTNRHGDSWRVIWRENGRQRSLSFADEASAQRFQTNITTHGVTAALGILEAQESAQQERTVREWLLEHVELLTGVQPATVKRYKRYTERDIGALGELPMSAVTEHAIAVWVQGLEGSGKTIANKHGFVSGAFNEAVRRGIIASNPCAGRRLPQTKREEMVFLTGSEFRLLHSHIPRDIWKNLATWLVSTGMRFSEATALTAADVDVKTKTCRIYQAWKYSGDYKPPLGAPKSKKSVRTISLPDNALDVVDLTRPGLLFTNGAGNRVTSQEFYNGGWGPGRKAAIAAGLAKKPRVHDLRHTCASWMIHAGVPLPVIQAHLGHESITTTIGTYGHLDQRAAAQAAAAIGAVFDGLGADDGNEPDGGDD